MASGKSVIAKLRRERERWAALANACRKYYAWLKTEAQVRVTHPQLGFDSHVYFRVSDPHALIIGNNVWIEPFSEVVVIHASESSPIPGRLEIGDGVWIGARANLRAAGGSIVIGSECLLAQNVSLIASHHGMQPCASYRRQPWRTDKTGVTLGRGVWIGAGAIILPGVHIGDHAIIGAGSVVTSDVGADEVWAGVPARFLRAVAASP